MLVRVLLFAAARDHVGADAVSVEVPTGATVAVLRTELARQFPVLASLLARSAIAVNHDFTEDSRVLAASDEVAIIPPVSGG
jgi:molybdopterin converting factor subunit 1